MLYCREQELGLLEGQLREPILLAKEGKYVLLHRHLGLVALVIMTELGLDYLKNGFFGLFKTQSLFGRLMHLEIHY
jgi:hypothetical protein